MKGIKLIGVNLLVLIGIFVLLELGVRLFFPFVHSQKIDSELFQANRFGKSSGLKPNATGQAFGEKVHVDAYGFRRDNRPTSEKGRKWLLIGDSVTFGVGVKDEETFAALLEDEMVSYNMLNPSVPGYTCSDYRNVIAEFIADNELNVEQVLLCYCLNDIYPEKSEDLQAGRGSFLKKSTQFLRGNSMLYNWLKGLVTNRPKAYYEYDLTFYGDGSEAYESMISTVLECDSICQANGVGFAFFAMPYSHQYTLKSDRFAVQEKIEGSLSAEGIKVIPHPGETLLETYSNHPEKAYLFGDGIHFSIGGHIKIAEHLERELAIQPQVLEPTVP